MDKNEIDVKVEECLKLANIDKFIDSLPDGIKTEVGDRGTRLIWRSKTKNFISKSIDKKSRNSNFR